MFFFLSSFHIFFKKFNGSELILEVDSTYLEILNY